MCLFLEDIEAFILTKVSPIALSRCTFGFSRANPAVINFVCAGSYFLLFIENVSQDSPKVGHLGICGVGLQQRPAARYMYNRCTQRRAIHNNLYSPALQGSADAPGRSGQDLQHAKRRTARSPQ